jgi:DNA-binding MarR family transcriptional regulator
MRATQDDTVARLADAYGLTALEASVLLALSREHDIRDIAMAHRVTQYAIRLLIQSLRARTGAPGVRELVVQLDGR